MILFVCSRETDYLQDLTYGGLVSLLGKTRVVDFPFHWQYHREKKYFWSRSALYPKNLGLVKNGEVPMDLSLSRVQKMLAQNRFSLVILGSAKPDACTALAQVFDSIKQPWVLIDGGDWSEIGGDFKRLGGQDCFGLFQSLCRIKRPEIIFKREMPLDAKEDFVFPFPFSFNVSHLPSFPSNSDKKNQVLFWAVESSKVRKEAFQLLKGRYDCDRNGSIPGQKARRYVSRGQSYLQALNQSRISLSLRGEGFDTLRYWEIPACRSLLISERPMIQLPNGFKDREHAVFCRNDLSDLLPLIDYYLEHHREREEIALRGQEHLFKHHTHVRRAEYLLEIVRERLKTEL